MRPPSELTAIVADLPRFPFDGTLFRATHLEALYGFHLPEPYAQPAPLYALGPGLRGARFTSVGGPPCIYLAGEPQTAVLEANRGSVHLLPPTVVFSASVHLDGVLDLTLAASLDALRTSVAELTAPWRLAQRRNELVPTQALGAAVYENGGFQAIRYPSAVAGGQSCYVVFCERVIDPSFVLVHDPAGNLVGRIPQ